MPSSSTLTSTMNSWPAIPEHTPQRAVSLPPLQTAAPPMLLEEAAPAADANSASNGSGSMQASPTAAALMASRTTTPTSLRVVFVDDDASNQRLGLRFLRKLGREYAPAVVTVLDDGAHNDYKSCVCILVARNVALTRQSLVSAMVFHGQLGCDGGLSCCHNIDVSARVHCLCYPQVTKRLRS